MKSQKSLKSLRLIFAVALVMAVSGPALYAQQVRDFSATITPATVNAGATGLYTVTITNDAASTKDIRMTKIVVPADFTGVSITTPNPVTSDGQAWIAVFDGTNILLGKVASSVLGAGKSVSVSFNATAPSITGSYEWFTTAYQDTTGDTPFTLIGSQPTVEVIAINFFFAGWRPPVNLPGPGDGWKSGSTMPVKFLVVDDEGAPVIDGVIAEVQIGDSDPVLAVLDDATTGQWKAEITLVGDGEQDVTITGNVQNVVPLSIVVKP